MNFIQTTLIGALTINLILGIIVYYTNSKRPVNQVFFILSLVLAGWLISIGMALTATNGKEAEFWIRQASVVSLLVPTTFNILRLSFVYRTDSLWKLVSRSRGWFIINAGIAIFCQTQFFLMKVDLPIPINSNDFKIPEPHYGFGFIIFASCFIAAFGINLYNFIRDTRCAEGIHRAELQFTLLGCATGMSAGIIPILILPLLTGSSQSAQFAPLCVFLLDGIIAYGIATRRIMDVADVLRRTVAYVVLTIYLIVLYTTVWLGVHYVLPRSWIDVFPFPHLIATLALAFSLAPAHGRMQRLVKQLYLTTPPIDEALVTRRANQILHSITTLPDLLKRFSHMVAEVVGTDHLVIFLLEKNGYVPKHAYTFTESSPPLPLSDPLVVQLKKVHRPIVADELERIPPTPELTAVAQRLTDLKVTIAVGIRAHHSVQGVMVLGPRVSGRIYGAIEQDTLQILCDQLAIAIENAQLYTGAQDSKIYNEILLDNLVSGVVAANSEGVITVFNREAQRVTHLESSQVLGRSVQVLPVPIAELIRQTLETGESLHDVEARLAANSQSGQEEIPVIMGSSLFKGHAGKVLGVLVVFNDLTTLKKLEMQVRRTDRLASIGTLSAGMAHEIKNPLVAIKTFTQLLPERYQDAEFRDNFSSLVGQEIDRIDSLVNQLLTFARPAKPLLHPTDLHELLDKSLRLIQHQSEQKGIEIHRNFSTSHIMIQADLHLLEQAFLNLFLNALDAMSKGDRLVVATEIVEAFSHPLEMKENKRENRLVSIMIKDTGQGIREEDLLHVFDPFFTTKSNGTGLGLSVAYQIIKEHDGEIEVESEWTKGTTFRIFFANKTELKVEG